MHLDGNYELLADKKFNKFVKKKLPPDLKKALDRKIDFLARNPFHNSLYTKKLPTSNGKIKKLGVDEVYEFYINMGFRCVFYVRHGDKQMILAKIGNHGDVERWFPR